MDKFKTKNKYHLKIKIEKEEVKVKEKPRKSDRKLFVFFNNSKKKYNDAIFYKMKILSNPNILEIRNVKQRAKSIYNSDEFSEILKIGKFFRKNEIKYITLYLILVLVFSLVTIAEAVYLSNFLYLFGIVAYMMLFGLLFSPAVSYRKFYNNIILDICVFAAGLRDKQDDFSYKTKSKKISSMNNGTWKKGKAFSPNVFSIVTNDFDTKIRKLTVRDIVNHYYVRKGRVQITKKKATVFSGYLFELKKRDFSGENKLRIALINKNTYFKTNALTADELINLNEISVRYPLLKGDWLLYVDKDTIVDKKLIQYLQKQLIQIENSLGAFNFYFYDNYVSLLLGIKSSREGLLTEYFEPSLTNAKQLSFSGFYSNIKALYVYTCITKVISYQRKIKTDSKDAWRF